MAIKLRREAFERFQRLKGWGERETAEKMGISRQTLWRTKLPDDDPEHTDPSAEFIAGALHAFSPLTFDDLFVAEELRTRNETVRRRNRSRVNPPQQREPEPAGEPV